MICGRICSDVSDAESFGLAYAGTGIYRARASVEAYIMGADPTDNAAHQPCLSCAFVLFSRDCA